MLQNFVREKVAGRWTRILTRIFWISATGVATPCGLQVCHVFKFSYMHYRGISIYIARATSEQCWVLWEFGKAWDLKPLSLNRTVDEFKGKMRKVYCCEHPTCFRRQASSVSRVRFTSNDMKTCNISRSMYHILIIISMIISHVHHIKLIVSMQKPASNGKPDALRLLLVTMVFSADAWSCVSVLVVAIFLAPRWFKSEMLH